MKKRKRLIQRRRWTTTEVENALALFEDGHGYEDIAVILGRPATAIKSKLEDLRYRNSPATAGRASAELLSARDERRHAYDARDLTALICGDPPKGFSALDRRES